MGKPPRQTKKERLKMKRERLESERKLKSQLKQTTSPSNKQESFDTDTIQQNVLEMKKRVCILKENYKKWKEGVSANCNLVDVGLHFVGHQNVASGDACGGICTGFDLDTLHGWGRGLNGGGFCVCCRGFDGRRHHRGRLWWGGILGIACRQHPQQGQHSKSPMCEGWLR